MAISRRRFSQTLIGLGLTLPHLSIAGAHQEREKKSPGPFRHGVASGDPLADRVILWTRISLEHEHQHEHRREHRKIPVKWLIATDPRLRKVVAAGVAHTGADRDYTVKVDAAGLEAGTTYYYCFKVLGRRSPIGRTKTLPVGHVDRLRVAFASCSNFPFGYFNVYGMIAERADLDVVLHLGDYIYEYANGTYGDGTDLGRIPEPNKEIVSLDDYRTRYAQYRTDLDLQEAHRQHPFICVWDDHESANNSWAGGAENHNPELGEGDWTSRKMAAVKAYYEWMPIRQVDPSDPTRSYRSFQYGDLMDLIMLDTRLYGRDEQVKSSADLAAIDDPNRHLLGETQMQWFLDQLSNSSYGGTRWRMVGQQVMFGQLEIGGAVFNVDQWDGYRAARSRVLNHLKEHAIDNTVILTGDIHTSWAMDITANPYDPALYDRSSGEGSVAVEFVTPAVSSPGITDPVEAAQTALYLQATNPHMKFVELFQRGYVLMDITHERTQAEWYHAQSIVEPNNLAQTLAAAMQTLAGSNRLSAAGVVSLPLMNPPALAPVVDQSAEHEREHEREHDA